MDKIIITAISDTHNKHKELTKDLPGGDLLLCSGDVSSMGYLHEIKNFCKWAANQDYEEVIFIAGNHDFGFQDTYEDAVEIINNYGLTYLQDDLYLFGNNHIYLEMIKIYGSPWQPEFYNWAFNLPKNDIELEQKWNNIPVDTDILLTHGPAFGYLDSIVNRVGNLGCELLRQRIDKFPPKIHIFGHIHGGAGYMYNGKTHFINASVLNEHYTYTNKPLTFEWIKETNELNFI